MVNTRPQARRGGRPSPFYWSDELKRALTNGDATAAGVELLRMDAGFRLVPTERAYEGGKERKRPVAFLAPPASSLKPGDPRFAVTDDPVVWQQWCAVCPDALMGVMPGDQFVVLDDDRGDFDASTAGIPGTYRDRSPRPGTHYWAQLPQGRRGRYAKLPGGGGDIITGDRYVVSAPSDGYSVIDVDAPILELPPSSPLWETLDEKPPSLHAYLPPLTTRHMREAQKVIRNLKSAPNEIPLKVASLLNGDVSGYASPSEADYNLALFASFWSQDPAVVLAVLKSSRLARAKWDRTDYLPRTISRALERRSELVRGAPSQHCDLSDILPEEARELTVSEVFSLFMERSQDQLDFTRVPIGRLATYCGCSEKTIQRAVNRAAETGIIETKVTCEHIGGGPKRTRWARLIRPSTGDSND